MRAEQVRVQSQEGQAVALMHLTMGACSSETSVSPLTPTWYPVASAQRATS